MTATTTVSTCDLQGQALNWAVAIAVKEVPHYQDGEVVIYCDGQSVDFNPSECWKTAGKLLDDYDVWMSSKDEGEEDWEDEEPKEEQKEPETEGRKIYVASCSPHYNQYIQNGETKLISACRAIVAVELGESVAIPNELLESAKND